MSRHAGDRLDEALFRRLSGNGGEGAASRAHEAILIATTDERGRPHPALLSYGEVLATSPALLRIAVRTDSTTARNLAARGALTLSLIGPEGVAYVKAAARALPAERPRGEEGRVAFEARVEDVLVDTPAAGEKAHLTSGITFAADDSEGEVVSAVPPGTEWVVDAHGCDPRALRSRVVLDALFHQVVAELELRPAGDAVWREFPGEGGITGLLLLTESHLACHTFPERGFAAFNLYCCRPRADWPWPERLREVLRAQQVSVRRLARGER